MKIQSLLFAALVGTGVFCSTSFAADNDKKVSKAQDVVDRIRQPDPPQVSTGTSNAADIARRENERERQRQAEESRKRKLDKANVPAPSR